MKCCVLYDGWRATDPSLEYLIEDTQWRACSPQAMAVSCVVIVSDEGETGARM